MNHSRALKIFGFSGSFVLLLAAFQNCSPMELRKMEIESSLLAGEDKDNIESEIPNVPEDPVSDKVPGLPPGKNFDLSLWKLTLPVDSNNQTSGTAYEIKPLKDSYENKPFFYTAADGAMVFYTPVQSATTSGSKYPRTELREMTSSGGNAAWTVEEGGSLSARLSVNEVPKKSDGSEGRVVIGQIHGPDDELCRLYYDNGKLYFYDDKAGSSQEETKFELVSDSGEMSNIPKNAKFRYAIQATRQALTVTAIYDGVTYTAVDPIGNFWPGKALYFKAGLYIQVGKPGSGAGTTGSGAGQVSFYELSPPSHP